MEDLFETFKCIMSDALINILNTQYESIPHTVMSDYEIKYIATKVHDGNVEEGASKHIVKLEELIKTDKVLGALVGAKMSYLKLDSPFDDTTCVISYLAFPRGASNEKI